MKKYIPLMVVSLLVASFAGWFILSPPNRFTATLAMESDAMSVVNYYYPNRIELQKQPVEAGLKLPLFISPEPKFGVLVIGQSTDSLITIVLDESPGDSVNLLYVDKNNNGDLTDDGDPNWDDDKGDYWIKEALVDVNYGNAQDKAPVPYPISFYRYKNRLPNSIMAFRNGYRKGFITLKDSTYKIALFDDDANGLFNEFDKGAIVIDLNQDGNLDGHTDSPEYFSLSASFNIHGLAYKVEDVSPSGDRITFAVVDTIVFPKTILEPGVRAPRFRIRDIQGQVVDLADYRNKVVLLDFWATWCRPWEENLSGLKNNYVKYNRRGFEIIGLSLDYDLEFLQAFLSQSEISWPQISDGRGWEMPLVEIYEVEAVPKNFLLDKTGVIRYKDLYGKKLESKIYELLNEEDMAN